MRKIHWIVISSLTLLSACVSKPRYNIYKDSAGIYRFEDVPRAADFIPRPENALRNADGKVVTDDNEAQKTFQSMQQPFDLDETIRMPDCGSRSLYLAKAAQFHAKADLQNKNWSQAIQNLDEAESRCSTIHNITAQDYFRAVAYEGMGDLAKAREYAQRFLNYSAAVDPEIYEQSNGPSRSDDVAHSTHANKQYAQFRERAKAMMQTNAPLTLSKDSDDVAKFYPNAFFRPGGNRREALILLPVIGYGNIMGSSFGAAAYYSTGNLGLGVSYLNSSTTGSYFGVKLRQSVYESPKRDLDIDVFAIGRTHKRYTYTRYLNGVYDDVHVNDTAFEPGLGIGATQRLWIPQFGVSGEIIGYNDQLNQNISLDGSLYTFYDIFREIDVEAGLIHNEPMVGVGILFLQVGYNFRNQGVELFVRGMDF